MERRDDGQSFENWKERTVACKIPTTFNDTRGTGYGHFVPAPAEALKKRKP